MKKLVIVMVVIALGGLFVAKCGGNQRSSPPTRKSSTQATASHAVDNHADRVRFGSWLRPRSAGPAAGEPNVQYSTLSTSDPVAMPPPRFSDQAVTGVVARESAPDPKRAQFEADQDRYLREVIAPRVRECWRKLDGDGRIEFLYLMRHDTGTGVGTVTPTTDIGIDTPVSVVTSDLTPEQSRRALDCMLDAVEGTSFKTELPDEDLGNLVGKYQIWTVGSPANH